MVRKAEKSGIKVTVVEPSDKLAEGIWKIYNETPIRQARAFTHYGESIQTVTNNMYADKNNTFIGAYLDDELVGFIQILYGDNIAIISNILSLQMHWDKSVNNALLAKAVEVCASKGATVANVWQNRKSSLTGQVQREQWVCQIPHYSLLHTPHKQGQTGCTFGFA